MLRKPASDALTVRKAADPNALTMRRMTAAPVLSSLDEATRSVDFVLLTQDPVIDVPPDLGEPVDEVVLVSGVEFKPQIPMVADHIKDDVRFLHGSLRNLRVSGDQLIARAFFADDPESDAVWRKVKGGHLTDISAGFRPTVQPIDIPPGMSATVAGKTYQAGPDRPMRITPRSVLREGSLVTIGADPRASARSSSDDSTTNRGSTPPKDSTMKFTDWLKAMGIDPATISDTQRAALQAEFDAIGDTQRADVEAQKGAKSRHAARVLTEKPATQERKAEDTQRKALEQADVERAAAEAGRRAVEAERTRVRQIEEVCGGEESLADTQRQAIAEGWTVERTSAEALKKIRASRTAAVGVPAFVGQPEMSREALGLSLTIRAGNDPMRGVKPSQKAERERLAEQADRMREMSLFDVCRAAIRLDGKQVPYGREDTIREAVSGGTLSNIFTQSVSATILRAFDEAGDSTAGMVVEQDVPDFKTNDRIRAGEAGNLKRLGRGGQAEHDTISDGVESYKVARYAKQFQIDEQDIIDDNFGILVQRPVQLGNAARRLRPDLVYAILVQKPTLADSVDLFHATHSNLQTGAGSALSATSLQTVLTALSKQTGVRPEVILNLMGRFLVVPQALQWTARALLRSGELREGLGGSATAPQPTYNVLRDTNLELRTEARLDNGFTNPADGTAVSGSATRWFVFGDPAMCPTIEVGYLRGTNRSPAVRSWIMDRGAWGIGFDVKHDIGAKAIDYRNMQCADGT